MTVAACLEDVLELLTSSGFSPSDAARDASVIGRTLLGWDEARWLSARDTPAADDFSRRFLEAARRRAGREPVAYIIGEREFFGRAFLVTPAVLIPRPETELIIEAALAHAGAAVAAGSPAFQVLDVGTGSGCLAIALACECPSARVAATDTSRAALDVAARNAAKHEVAGRITWLEASLTGGLRDADVIVSNPPYVAEADRASLAQDVVEYEPHAALFGGRDGLDVIRALVPAAAASLRPGGLMVMEIGQGQEAAVRELLEPAQLEWVETRLDLAGIPRVIVAHRAPRSRT